jgi:hypothetical protein
MLRSPKATLLRVEAVDSAWSTMCPEETFFGHTLEQYRVKIKPMYEVRAEMTDLDTRWTGLKAQRQDVDDMGNRLAKNIVGAVRSHPKHGDDSPVYAAMGFTRESERGGGRKRVRPAPEDVTPVAQEDKPQAEKS